MSVKEGYKQTEIGVIPQDWEIVTLKDISSRITNGFVGVATTHYVDEANGILYLQGYNIEENAFNLTGVKYVSKEFNAAHAKSILKTGDLLTIQTGDVGLTTYVTEELAGANCHALVITKTIKRKVNPIFTSYFLNFKETRARLKLLEIGSTMKHLNVGDLLHFKIIKPELIEQEKIAKALSDTDAYIDSLEKLIAKKQLIKEGLMANLLTGKERLAEFVYHKNGNKKGYKESELGLIPEDWNYIDMNSIGYTYGGLSGKSKSDFKTGHSHYIPFVNVISNTVIDENFLEKVIVEEYQNLVLRNDLIFNGSSETPEEVCLSSMVDFDMKNLYLNSFCFGFRAFNSESYNPLYLSYWYRSEQGRKAILFMAQGSTRYNISKSQFLKMKVVLPSKVEQTRIANLISQADAEIKSISHKMNKAKSIKQGMMQKLLTGEIRLINPHTQP